MQTTPQAPSRTRGPATLAALGLAALLLGCSAETDLEGNLVEPLQVVASENALATCPEPAGSASLELFVEGTTAATGFPASTPVNRLTVQGLATGVPAGESIFLIITPQDEACPILESITEVTAEADGSFVAQVDIGEARIFRLTAVAFTGVEDDIACDSVEGCVTFAGASPTAVSQPLAVLVE